MFGRLMGTFPSLLSLEDEVNAMGSYNSGADGSFGEAISKVGEIGNGLYSVAAKSGVAVALVGMVIVGIMFIFNSGGQGRQENKGRLVNTLLGVLFIGAAAGIVGFVVALGSGLFEGGATT